MAEEKTQNGRGEEERTEKIAPKGQTEDKKPRVKKAKEPKEEKPAEMPKVEKKKEVKLASEATTTASSKPKKQRKKKEAQFVARGKRKESIARAHVSKGNGLIRVNHLSLVAFATNKYVREIVREPLRYLGPEALTIDVEVNVFGGGVMGQAQASRTAIAKALVEFFPDQNLKDTFLNIDRSLLIEDVRRVETKKFKGPKARARFQKSYR